MSKELLSTALAASRAGAEVLRQRLNTLTSNEIDEKGRHDFVTVVDRESEAAILQIIRAAHPDHSILAEESGYHEQNSDFRWIIDPLDGTTNYIHGYPYFAVSIAVQQRGEIVAGVVLDVSRDEEFTASKGDGAYLNGQKFEVSSVTALDRSLILTGFPFKAQQYLEDFISIFRQLLPETSGIRRAGSAALDLANLACGRAEGFWEFGLSAWDIAAGEILVREAGGIITDIEGGENFLDSGHVMAGNQEIYQHLKAMIDSHFSSGFFID
jgi:myo-inositol-1(or 4)-monophosphatase